MAALLDGVDLDAASRSLEGVVKPVVKSSVVNATVRDHTDILKRVVQVRGWHPLLFSLWCASFISERWRGVVLCPQAWGRHPSSGCHLPC